MSIFPKKEPTTNQKEPKSLQTTHDLLKKLLTFAQFFGIFPIYTLNDGKIQFRFPSWKVFYASFVCFGYFLCAVSTFQKSFAADIPLNQLSAPLFYTHACLTVLCFLQLAQNWPNFLTRWTKIEELLLKQHRGPSKLYQKIRFLAVLLIIVTLLEHIFAVCNFVFLAICRKNKVEYFREEFEMTITWIPYHNAYGFLPTVLTWMASVTWTFGDLFIIIISIILTDRFRIVNVEIKSCAKSHTLIPKNYKTDVWRRIREDYDSITNTVRILDQLLSNLILVSYSCNLTFILIQLFNSLRQMESATEAYYIYFSFIFVIAKLVSVTIFAASVNEESQAALPCLTSLPTECFNKEVQRLITQIHIDLAVFTGHNFFRITKGLVLSVAAAIITYELVLIQFNQSTLNKYMSTTENPCPELK